MLVSTGLYRFVSVCTNYFCSNLIVKDFMDLYRFGENTGTKTGTRNNPVHRMLIQKVYAITQDSNNSDGIQFNFSQEPVYRIICLYNTLQHFENIFLNQPGVLLLLRAE